MIGPIDPDILELGEILKVQGPVLIRVESLGKKPQLVPFSLPKGQK